MSRTLTTLIKRSVYLVEEVQKKIAQTRKAEAALQGQIDAWNRQMAEGNAESAPTLGAFITRGRAQVAQLEALLRQTRDLLARQQDELRAQYAEQKRYEILLEQKQTEAQRTLRRKQQGALDEAAGVLHNRKQRVE